MAQHLVVAGFLHVQDLAFEWQHSLKFPVPSLLGGPACGFTLDQVQLAAVRLAFAAISQLAWQAAAIKRALAPGQIPGLPGCLASAGRFDRLVDDLLGDREDSARRTSPGVR